MSNEEARKAFRQAIARNRYDQTTRLVYADWLEQFGDNREIVNIGTDYPMPIISTGPDLLGADDRLGVIVRWPDGRGLAISPNGGVFQFH